MQITIKPKGDVEYEASLGGRPLCVSKTPFFAAARALMAEGCDPNEPLELIRGGKVALTQRIGDAALLAIREPAKGGLGFVRYQPFDRA